MGLRGFEPLTSPLSGVRSNQLSYRPTFRTQAGHKAAGGVSQLRRTALLRVLSPVMKGHEDDGMFFGEDEALPMTSTGAFGQILRKEVIQPQVPLRLPCYDLVPVTGLTVGTPEPGRLRVLPASMT